ncbi:MAG: PilZ domain-containing protein [Halieaceae bacterium]|nr:PilZ domain-containing protein [Halieaceae bacterium]
MTEHESDRRRYTRVPIELPVEIRQGASVWHRSLVNLSLAGLAIDEPPNFDAQYNEPFTIVLETEKGNLELHAYLQHAGRSQLGFALEHLDAATLGAMRGLMEPRIDDPSILDQEALTL